MNRSFCFMRNRKRVVIGVLAAALLGSAGCASGAASGPRLLSWSPPEGQACNPLQRPERLPAVGAVVDSAAVSEAAVVALGEGGRLLLAVGYDTLGSPVTPRVMERTVGPDEAESFAARVADRLIPRDAGPSYMIMMLIEPGSVQVGRGEACRPVLANQRDVQRALSTAWQAHLRSTPGARPPRRSTVLRVHVEATGAVMETQIQQQSDDPAADRIALAVAGIMRFHPARLNGRAVRVWTQFDVTLQTEEPDGGDRRSPFPPPPPPTRRPPSHVP